jgi:hypothetical protein
MSDDQIQEPKELREAYDRQVAATKAIEAEFRTFKTSTLFKEQGLTPKHAELYLAANPNGEISPEAIQTFAAEYGLQPATAPAPAPAADEHYDSEGSIPPLETTLTRGPQAANSALASLQGAAGTPQATFASAAPAVMTTAEFQKLLQSNPAEAAKAYAEGRAPRNEQNVQADQLVAKGIIR